MKRVYHQGFQKIFFEIANLGSQNSHFWRHSSPKLWWKIASFWPNIALQSAHFTKLPPKLPLSSHWFGQVWWVIFFCFQAVIYYLHLKMVMSFLKFEIFRESLFTFLLQKLHFDTSWTVLEKRISQNNAKRFKSKQTLLSFHKKCKSKNISTTKIDTKLTLCLIFCQIFELKA